MDSWKYLVIDKLNGGVLYSAPTLANASNVSAGILSTTIIQIPLYRDHFSSFKKYDFDNDMLHASKDRNIKPLPAQDVTDDFLERRRVAKIRGKYLLSVELVCLLGREKSLFHYPEEISAELEIELNKCRVAEGYFSQAIKEYATVQEIEVGVAYEELRFLVDGARVEKIRNFAFYQKYIRLMNSSPLEELDKCYSRLIDEVFLNARM